MSKYHNNTLANLKSFHNNAASKPVVAGVASMPSRINSLRLTLQSIYWQVDHVYVYLNNFEEVPACLRLPNITVFRSQDTGDLEDVGKFFALTFIDDAIIFTIDDDIVYPNDYVAKMINTLERFEYNAVVGVHGVIMPENPKSFFDRHVLHFRKELSTSVPVSLLGTGTCAFDLRRIGLSLAAFSSYGMADIHLGVYLKQQGIP